MPEKWTPEELARFSCPLIWWVYYKAEYKFYMKIMMGD